jgi:hypothetical protein
MKVQGQVKLKLIQKPRGALGPWAIAVAIEFLDLQLQMGDQRLVVGLPGVGGRSLRPGNNQCRFQRFDVVWQRFKAVTHGADGITKEAI